MSLLGCLMCWKCSQWVVGCCVSGYNKYWWNSFWRGSWDGWSSSWSPSSSFWSSMWWSPWPSSPRARPSCRKTIISIRKALNSALFTHYNRSISKSSQIDSRNIIKYSKIYTTWLYRNKSDYFQLTQAKLLLIMLIRLLRISMLVCCRPTILRRSPCGLLQIALIFKIWMIGKSILTLLTLPLNPTSDHCLNWMKTLLCLP